MLTTSMVFKTELQKAIADAISFQTDKIINPHGASDFSEYKHYVGVVAGLRQALELIEEVESVINKRERGV